MGLRCSLIGHDWGESEIERDRDEQGSEVVLTVREYEVCSRCGDRNLISENTEVTTLAADDDAAPVERAPEPTRDGAEASAGDDAATEGAGDAGADAEPAAAGDAPESGVDADGDAPREAGAAEILGDDASGSADATAGGDEPADDGAAAAADAAADDPMDDAVFIDDAEDDAAVDAVEDAVADAEEPVADAAPDSHGDAAPGTTGDAAADASGDAPEAAATDSSADGEFDEPAAADETAVADDDGVVLDDDADEGAADDREHGEWPDGPEGATGGAPEAEPAGEGPSAGEAATGQFQNAPTETDDDGYDAEFIDDDAPSQEPAQSQAATDSPSGIKSAGSTAPPGQRHQRNGELVCPNCSNAESADRTSLRAGDICPECRKGYLSNPSE